MDEPLTPAPPNAPAGEAGAAPRPALPFVAPPRLPPPFPGVLGSVLLVMGVFFLANLLSVPVMMVLALIKFGPTEFGSMVRSADGWMRIVGGIDVALLSIPCNTLGFGLVTWLGWRRTGRPFAEVFPLRAVAPLLWVGMAVTFVGGLLTANLASDLLLKVLPVPQWVVDFFSQFLGKDKGVTSYVLLALVAPVTEEFLFRGLIAWGLSWRYGILPVSLISAALFGGMHVLPWQVVPAFLLGALFAWWRLESGSLWPSLVAHFITNSVAFFQGRNQSVKEALTTPPQPLVVSLLGLLILAAGFIWCRTLFRRAAERETTDFA